MAPKGLNGLTKYRKPGIYSILLASLRLQVASQQLVARSTNVPGVLVEGPSKLVRSEGYEADLPSFVAC